ncbi:MAG: Ig-like domain-containing protein, partial [Acidimicrobiia bacterium]
MIFTKGLRRVRLLVAVAAVVLSTLPLVAREQAGALEGTDFAGAMPDCGSVNVDGKGGIGWSSKWHLTTSRPAGSIVHPGDEWIVTFKVVSKPGSTPIGNDGPDPINLGMAFQGPVAKVSQSAGYDRLNFNFGPKEVGPAGFGGVSSWSFDANSGPTVQKSDGVNATYQATVRATAAGVVTLAGLAVNGHDPTPPAGQFQCTIPVDLKWTVVQLAAPVSGLDNVRTDARYALVLADDASNGNHAIEIDVLANDDDPNNAGGPGDLSEVRISAWSPASTKGGSVRCGTDAQQDAAADAVFLALADGPCRYTPPQDFSGNDSFTYRLRGAGGVEKQVVVSVQVVGNQAPKSSPPALGSTVNQAESFDLKPYILDLEGDPYTCALAVGPAHGQLVVAPDCTAEWTPDAGYSGQDSFAVQICDEHPHLAGSLGSVPTVRAPLYDQGNPNDLTETSTRRCSNLQGTILVSDVLIFPPQGLPDADVVDAGYPVDGIGDYAVEIPILDNDVDIDGPQPGDPAWNGTVQIIEHDEALGAAAVVGDLLTFTPARSEERR